MAHLRHFLSGTILFSSISPNFERNLKDELYGCFKYIGIPFDVLDRMPVRDRKFYIAKHNGITEEVTLVAGEDGSLTLDYEGMTMVFVLATDAAGEADAEAETETEE